MRRFSKQRESLGESQTRTLIIFLLSLATVIFFCLQIIMPRIGLSLVPNFDTSCYSGTYAFIEKISDNSSCGARGADLVGFPLVVNFSYNNPIENFLVLLINISLLAIVCGVVVYIFTKKDQNPEPQTKVTPQSPGTDII